MNLEGINNLKKLEKEQLEQNKKDFEDAKKIANQIFKSKDGKFLLKYINKNVFNKMEGTDLNPNLLCFEKGIRFVYNYLFYTLLDAEVSKEILFNNNKND